MAHAQQKWRILRRYLLRHDLRQGRRERWAGGFQLFSLTCFLGGGGGEGNYSYKAGEDSGGHDDDTTASHNPIVSCLISAFERESAIEDATRIGALFSRRLHSVQKRTSFFGADFLPRGAYNATSAPAAKFLRPDGMSESCEWFPSDPKLPGSTIDYSTTVIIGNIGGQLACGLFLVFFGCLGDFGTMRYKGLVLGWVFFSLPPIGRGICTQLNAVTRTRAKRTGSIFSFSF